MRNNPKLPNQRRPADPLGRLAQGAAILGLDLPRPCLEQFRFYLAELERWNARVNLTGLKTAEDLVVKGFLDSLAVLPYLGQPASLADLGSGAGFPGLVLKLARPELALTLVEAREKKAAFLEYVAACLKLSNVAVVRVHLTPARARDWGVSFGAVVSRAAFKLSGFLELAAPLLAPGGVAMALKGPGLPPAERQAAEKLLELLALESLTAREYHLPLTGEARLLVVARRSGVGAPPP